ncbi:MAG: hypothetical protein Q9169_002693 [Polycauliona sp. 2 TL-2023]
MATVGPELPPHLLAKRKRQEETQEPTPQPPPHSRSSSTSSNTSWTKRPRTIGPAPPPAPLSERPSQDPEPQTSKPDDSSSSDDDFGPSLPPTNSHAQQSSEPPPSQFPEPTAPSPPKREEWMLVPPTNSDWSTRMDPTKLKSRKFATGKGAKAPSSSSSSKTGDISTIWTETPSQKRQRLEDEMLGIKKPAQLIDGKEEDLERRGKKEDEAQREETERRIREYNERNRGVGSLYEEHRRGVPREKEDDASKRAFDKEKDMGGGMKIGHAKRKEMVGKAADFGSRFAGGKYL